MNQTFVVLILGVVQLILAVWYFDTSSSNQVIVSVLLFLSGASLLLQLSESYPLRRSARYMRLGAAALAVLLILKILLVG